MRLVLYCTYVPVAICLLDQAWGFAAIKRGGVDFGGELLFCTTALGPVWVRSLFSHGNHWHRYLP